MGSKKKVKRATIAEVRVTHVEEQPVADIEHELGGSSEQVMD